jgi:hypothetical protein
MEHSSVLSVQYISEGTSHPDYTTLRKEKVFKTSGITVPVPKYNLMTLTETSRYWPLSHNEATFRTPYIMPQLTDNLCFTSFSTRESIRRGVMPLLGSQRGRRRDKQIRKEQRKSGR